ncbi:hypothetical protein G3578_02450 [Brevibacillus sp. SYP-B805]|uniref:hypothetical protein n=1 Tax=Brevibacillus sp. SYP-B805 TaxID=1578199 RepID=UPI0013E9D245|nr:hypothetical protein [Brevibacillus sp. SYP-B805]NGQ94032.1 hypothetical protein [Brevibacillus sp. SYP-B805]
MVGTNTFNLAVGLFAFLVTLVTALSGNVFLVSLERAVCAFLLFFLLAYLIRWLAALITRQAAEKTGTPHQIDLVTPHESTGEPAERTDDPAEGFSPLVAPRIERTDEPTHPINIANTIRRFTDD